MNVMWAIMGITLLALIVFLIDFPALKASKKKKDLFIYICFLSFGVLLTILISLNVSMPSPLDLLNYLFRPLHPLLS